jgi:hypothetical protein
MRANQILLYMYLYPPLFVYKCKPSHVVHRSTVVCVFWGEGVQFELSITGATGSLNPSSGYNENGIASSRVCQ